MSPLNPEIKIPQIPQTTIADPGTRQVLDSIRTLFNTRAFGKSEVDKWVTWRDLVNNDIVVYQPNDPTFASNNGGNFWLSGESPDDYTLPPTPTGFSVNGAFNNIILDWDDPNALYKNHAYAEIWRSGTNSLGTAVLIGQANGAVYADPVATSSTYYYWIRFVSKKNVVGAYNSLVGTVGQTALDPSYALQVLAGSITESQLYSSLATRINLIDAPVTTANSVAARVQAEATARAAAILAEASERANQDGALQTQINLLSAASSGDFQELIAAVQTEQTARIAGDAAEATARETLATQVRGTYTGTDIASITSGLLYSERQARSTQDTALATSISALSATVTSNNTTVNAAITSESTTRANADTALTNSLNSLSSTVTNNYSTLNSAITTESSTRASADTAISNSVTSLSSTVTNNYNTLNAAITSEATTRANADTSLSSQITTVSAQATKTRTYSQGTAPTTGMVTGDLWFNTADNNKAYRYSGTAWVATDDSRISSNLAAIQTETTARTTADTALASQITTVQAVADLKNRIYRQTSEPTGTLTTGDLWFDTDDNNKPYRWTGLAWDSVEDPRIPSNSIAIQTEATARVNADNSLFAQYTVKIDANGYVSGFGLASTAVNSTPFSDFIIRADRFSIASPTGPGITPVVPFVVTTTATTVNGVSVPVGIYMDAAFIKNGSITNAKIGNAAIDSAKIVDASIVTAKLGDASITTAKIQDASIIGAKIALATITSANILDAAIGTAKIADASITNAKIVDASITNAKIVDLDAAKITAGYIAAARIAAGSITADKITTNGLIIRDASGNVILGAGSALNAAYAAPGTLNSDLTASITNASLTANWNNIYGTGKPQNNATYGATFGSNISGQIDSSSVWTYIANGAIQNAQIANAAISSAKIGDLEVGTLKIAGNAVSFGGAIVGGGTNGFYTPVGGILAVTAYSGGSFGDYLVLVLDGGQVLDQFPPGAPVWVNGGGDAGNSYIQAYGPATGVASVYLGPGTHYIGFFQNNQAYNSARIIWNFFQR